MITEKRRSNLTYNIQIHQKGEEKIEVNTSKNHLEVQNKTTRFITRIIKETFPDFNSVIPQELGMQAALHWHRWPGTGAQQRGVAGGSRGPSRECAERHRTYPQPPSFVGLAIAANNL